jgi:Protein tyrosine and serine/threonine kinase
MLVGMSRIIEGAAESGKSKNATGPVRWMAVETVRHGTYSEKSDGRFISVPFFSALAGNDCEQH